MGTVTDDAVPRPLRRRGRRRGRAAAGVVAALVLAACSGGGSSDGGGARSTTTATPPATTATTAEDAEAWRAIEDRVAQLAPTTAFLAARLTDDGACEPVHAVDAEVARPMGSQFKLYVLGALAEQITAGDLSWDRTLVTSEATTSLGNGDGSLQFAEPGTTVTVEETATKMIEISDNTATDMLIGLVGREAVEDTAEAWMADPTANEPFLTTREMLLLHYVPGLAERFLATPREERAAFLAAEVDPRPLGDVGLGYTTDPSHIETIEWFATPQDVCAAYAGLRDLAADPALAPLSAILSRQDVGLDLPADEWPTVWYKGGSESGVLALGWMAVDADGEAFVVQAMLTDPDVPLADDSMTDLIDICRDAFRLLHP